MVYTRAGKTYRVKARTAVMAGGGWTTRHVVRDLPQAQQDAYSQFYRSPCMMANVALRNWRFLYNMGMTGFRWFEGVGNYTEVRKTALIGADSATISPDSPVVLPLKVLYSYPGIAGRRSGTPRPGRNAGNLFPGLRKKNPPAIYRNVWRRRF